MIRVKRPAGSTPQVLRKHDKGHKELSKNNLLHAAGKPEDMKFEAYKDKSVREALNSLRVLRIAASRDTSGRHRAFSPKGKDRRHRSTDEREEGQAGLSLDGGTLA